ncbi:ABC transporter substrate-binding protein [Pseudomonas aeruginosa]
MKSLAELKGKRIAVTKAAGSHYLLIAALASAGLEFSDIQPAYLTPADGRPPSRSGKVDAWVTWDPYVASAQRHGNARGYWPTARAWPATTALHHASSDYARKHPEVLQQVFAELQRTRALAQGHPGRRGQGAGAAVGAISMPLPSSRRMRGAATTYNR